MAPNKIYGSIKQPNKKQSVSRAGLFIITDTKRALSLQQWNLPQVLPLVSGIEGWIYELASELFPQKSLKTSRH